MCACSYMHLSVVKLFILKIGQQIFAQWMNLHKYCVYRVLNKFATCKNVIFQLLLWLLILIGCRWLFLCFGCTIIASKWEWTKTTRRRPSTSIAQHYLLLWCKIVYITLKLRCRKWKTTGPRLLFSKSSVFIIKLTWRWVHTTLTYTQI